MNTNRKLIMSDIEIIIQFLYSRISGLQCYINNNLLYEDLHKIQKARITLNRICDIQATLKNISCGLEGFYLTIDELKHLILILEKGLKGERKFINKMKNKYNNNYKPRPFTQQMIKEAKKYIEKLPIIISKLKTILEAYEESEVKIIK